MKKYYSLINVFLAILLFAFVVQSCKDDDDDPVAITLSTLDADGVDLNAATAPSNVPIDPTITATFNTDLDASTVTENTVTLTRDYDDELIDIDIQPGDRTIIITPVSPLASGALYELSFGDIESSGGEALTPFSRAFTTEGTFAPSGVVAHWNFENNANDVVGTWNPSANGVIAITYEAGRNAAAGQAAVFDGDASIIEIPNGDQLMDTDDFTLSFWVKTNSTGHVDANANPAGYFVIGLGAFYGFQFEIPANFSSVKLASQYELADATTSAEDLFFNGEGLTDQSWQGWTYSRDLTGSGGVAGLVQDQWAHIVCTYDSESKLGSMYINGDLMKEQDFDLWPDDAPKRTVVGLQYGGAEPEVYPVLSFGFIHSREGTLWDTEPWGGYDFPTANHFKGSLDDVRIFHTALSATEVELMYNSEMP
jgi:hypothetical protein